jgi:NTE family protein
MRALVLSGGGGLGAYQVGALGYMLGVLKVPYQLVVGVSVGSINGIEVAQWPIGEEDQAARSLCEMWLKLRTKDVIDPRFMQPVSLLWQPSTHSFEPLAKLLQERLDIDRMRASGRAYRAVAVDCLTGDFRLYGPETCDKHQLIKGILGSSATPIIHPNIRAHGQVLYDGGIRDVSPIRQAIKAGATEIDLVLTQSPKLGPWDPEPDRLWNTALRVFSIMFRELVENDLDRVELYNAAVEARHPKGVGKRIVKMRVIRPTDPLPGDAASFEPEQTERLMALGRQDAEAFADW